MLDYAQSFEQFAGSVKPMDLALYAGVGLVLWVLFKDKMSPVQNFVKSVVDKVKGVIGSTKTSTVPSVVVPTTVAKNLDKEDVFFQLVVSWKQTRDLAVKSNCVEAVKVADQMFPYLSPTVCDKGNVL